MTTWISSVMSGLPPHEGQAAVLGADDADVALAETAVVVRGEAVGAGHTDEPAQVLQRVLGLRDVAVRLLDRLRDEQHAVVGDAGAEVWLAAVPLAELVVVGGF